MVQNTRYEWNKRFRLQLDAERARREHPDIYEELEREFYRKLGERCPDSFAKRIPWPAYGDARARAAAWDEAEEKYASPDPGAEASNAES